jgi:hypothetical protein
MTAVSFNLTEGKSRLLSAEEAGWFDSPLILGGPLTLVEVVFWGPRYPRTLPTGHVELGAWVHLVRVATPRVFDPSQQSIEVSIDDLPQWEAWMHANAAPV